MKYNLKSKKSKWEKTTTKLQNSWQYKAKHAKLYSDQDCGYDKICRQLKGVWWNHLKTIQLYQKCIRC